MDFDNYLDYYIHPDSIGIVIDIDYIVNPDDFNYEVKLDYYGVGEVPATVSIISMICNLVRHVILHANGLYKEKLFLKL